MQDFRDKVAVVTGGASGIGRAMVDRFAQAGMRIVIADVEASALASAERELRDRGVAVLGVKTDVAKPEDVDALARRQWRSSAACTCSATTPASRSAGPMWEHTLADWEWVFGVNLWGVIYGIRTFVPIMLKQNQPAHIVSTASLAGLTSNAFLGVYNATKHAVVTLSRRSRRSSRWSARRSRCRCSARASSRRRSPTRTGTAPARSPTARTGSSRPSSSR
jgi:NAD(P)-dependent dehydrogenase (short-subunit alcohol dehydrogenase family)